MRVEYDPSERVPAKSDVEVVREYLEGASGADLSVLNRLVGDERLKQMDTVLRSTFTGLRFDVDDLASDGDRVSATFTLTGTHEAPFLGMESTGRQVSARGTGSFKVEGSKIVDSAIELDEEAILRQIRAAPEPAEGEAEAAY